MKTEFLFAFGQDWPLVDNFVLCASEVGCCLVASTYFDWMLECLVEFNGLRTVRPVVDWNEDVGVYDGGSSSFDIDSRFMDGLRRLTLLSPSPDWSRIVPSNGSAVPSAQEFLTAIFRFFQQAQERHSEVTITLQ